MKVKKLIENQDFRDFYSDLLDYLGLHSTPMDDMERGCHVKAKGLLNIFNRAIEEEYDEVDQAILYYNIMKGRKKCQKKK